MQVADQADFKGRRFPGRAKAAKEVELSFRVAGPLITLPVNVGDVVTRGDVIASIDPRDFEVQLQNVNAQVLEAEAVATRTQADLERLDGVRAQNPDFVSQLDYDAAAQSRDSARANVASLNASVESARDQLRYTKLLAPFDGTVVDTYVENFEDVAAKQRIVRIVDDSRIEFEINIPENLISLAPSVRNAWVEFDAFPNQPVAATIKEIGAEASRSTRTYPVTLSLEQPADMRVLPGMAGTAYGNPPEDVKGDRVEVPMTAVLAGDDGETSYVWIFDTSSETVSRQAVEVADVTQRGATITSGLEPGTWIATAGVHYLREGQKVRLLKEAEE